MRCVKVVYVDRMSLGFKYFSQVCALWLCVLAQVTAFAQLPQNESALERESNERYFANDAPPAEDTRRLTSLPLGGVRIAPPLAGTRSGDAFTDGFEVNAIGQNNRGKFPVFDKQSGKWLLTEVPQTILYHQPLIQVKLRIAEIVREDNFAAKTVLDFVRDRGKATEVETHRVNARQGSTTSTRFTNAAALIGPENLSGNGGLINLTANQLNLIGEFLATEFSADLITCPQVVTLNGQTVQLLSGANVPFTLGQSILQDGTLAVQDVFYKHVGTNLTVTPRIVNWGPRAEGQGESPIMNQQVVSWNLLAGMMSYEGMLTNADKEKFGPFADTTLLMPTKLQGELLQILNSRSKLEIVQLLSARQSADSRYPYTLAKLFLPLGCQLMGENGCPLNWTPSDCTVDVELILRQSQTGTQTVADLKLPTDPTSDRNIDLTSEEVGAAIGNVVQLKSGQGAVIAGLIGERDIKSISKIPVLGDIPWVGAAFRSKVTNRQKTEIVIFLEAEVLPSDVCEAMAQASEDFPLTRNYLSGDVLNNPLDAGIQRAGLGSYLPPRTSYEKIYWERLGRKVQKSCVTAKDVLR